MHATHVEGLAKSGYEFGYYRGSVKKTEAI